MRRAVLFLLVCVAVFACVAMARAQTRPYIGYVYPAGGQQGATFHIKLGGQGLDDIEDVFVSGSGVSVRVLEYNRVLNPQEIQLLNEQLRELRRARTNRVVHVKSSGAPMNDSPMMMMNDDAMMASAHPERGAPASISRTQLIAKVEKRIGAYVNRPACAAIASIVYAEVTIDPGAPPGERELRATTANGVSNPLVFQVGQLPEHTRPAMLTASFQVLGKEELSLRRRPTNEVEVTITPPCTVNGQVASGELNKYRFSARKGQKLVITALARQLIPFIADAVPGWFQPVIALYDSGGKEVAYADDYRFKPDPTLLCQIPKDDDYVLAIFDGIYRGREDFVYRVTIGEVPFLTSIFPLGSRIGAIKEPAAKGWNIDGATVTAPSQETRPGTQIVTVTKDRLTSNPLPFVLDTLPEITEKEPNHRVSNAQSIQLPVIINGRIDLPDDWDVFRFQGKAGDLVAVEVSARRLDSPLDAVVKVTDANGRVLALNDDREDLAAGANTHHADSYLMAKLPTNGIYCVHIGDTARSGGPEYGYRLRISPPQPDFALRVVPSSISMRKSGSAVVTVYAQRKDGFTNTIRVALQNPPAGFSAPLASISGTQTMTRLTIRGDTLSPAKEPVTLSIMGTGRVSDRVITNFAVPAEDRMQAFLWRHLVPAKEFKALVYDPSYVRPAKRFRRQRPPVKPETNVVASAGATNDAAAAAKKPKFSAKQVAGRLRQLALLHEEGLLTDEFYEDKVAECEALQ